ncbi:MAG: HAD hydrolase-like protein, partial [Flavobacterium sp.]|nr:HAD hydrolase-like protein [Flavobacterium sp.]
MIQTVIFDMGGVIVDTEPVHHYAYDQQFKQLGIHITPEMYSSFTGNSTKNIFERLKVEFNLEQDVPTLVQTKRNFFNDAFDNKEDLYLLDGVEDLIKELYSKGMQLVLASSSATVTINRVFNRFNLHQYFTHVVSGEDF